MFLPEQKADMQMDRALIMSLSGIENGYSNTSGNNNTL